MSVPRNDYLDEDMPDDSESCYPSLCKQRENSQNIEAKPRMYKKNIKILLFIFIMSKFV